MGKVIFITFAKKGLGFWLRYTLSYEASSLWLSVFNNGAVKGLRVRYSRDLFKMKGLNIELSNSKFSLERAEAKSKAFSWDLSIKSIDGKYNPLPLLVRLVRRDKYLLVTPLAVFNGYVDIENEHYDIKDHAGMIGLIESRRELSEWGWAHCSGFNENSKYWIDILITRLGSGHIAIGLLKLDKLYNIGGVMGRKFDGSLGLNGINWSFRLGHYSIYMKVASEPSSMIIAEYEDPEGLRYCHNTEIGNMELLINDMKFSCVKRAFFEYGTSQRLPVLARINVINE